MWTACCCIMCEPPAIHLTHFHLQAHSPPLCLSPCCILYLLSLPGLRRCHADRGRRIALPPHGPQSSMPVPQCQANKKALSQITFLRHLHNSRTRTAEAITVTKKKKEKYRKQVFDVNWGKKTTAWLLSD